MKPLSADYDDWAETGDMRTSQVDNALISVLIVIVVTTVLVWSPVYVDFLSAIGGALCWCFWLERRSPGDETLSAVVCGERLTPTTDNKLMSPVVH
jgi:hypothetical protein